MEYFIDSARRIVCVPYSVENLHKMAEDLGIRRCWFHKDHYDSPKCRFAELWNKCTRTDSKSIVNIINRWR